MEITISEYELFLAIGEYIARHYNLVTTEVMVKSSQENRYSNKCVFSATAKVKLPYIE